MIIGAYHIGALPGWREIVKEQAERLRSSGLLAKTGLVFTGISCLPDKEEDEASEFVNNLLDDKAVITTSSRKDIFEFLTLEWLQYNTKDRPDYEKVWYVHTKGVMSGEMGHRLVMENTVIDDHERCLEILETHDTCGVYWRGPGTHGAAGPHYAGNMWWANAAYLRTLPGVDSLDQSNRVWAEFWIGMGKDHKPCEFPARDRWEDLPKDIKQRLNGGASRAAGVL